MKLLIQNARTFASYLSQKGNELLAVNALVDGQKIVKLTTDPLPTDGVDRAIDAQNKVLLPGLVDPQVHFREPGQTDKEDLESGSRAAARGGFTTVVCMPNTNPTTDSAEVVNHIHQRVKEIAICRVLPTASVTIGLMGRQLVNMDSLQRAGVVALTDDGKGIQSDEVMLQAMKQAAGLGLSILDHSEDESLSKAGAIHLGEVSRKFQLPGIDPMSEAVHVERGCRYALETGCHFHILHISTKKSIEQLKRAKALGAPVTAEVSPHHLLLCDEDIPIRADGSLDANWKMNPPLRSKEDRAACVEALIDGSIDAIATDHAPHTVKEKNMPIEQAPFGIVGLETAFAVMYTHFVKTGKITFQRLVCLMSEKAADLFKLPYGRLHEGGLADLCLMDIDTKYQISSKDFHSKGRNTPFEGQEVFGRNHLTLLAGKIVYEDL